MRCKEIPGHRDQEPEIGKKKNQIRKIVETKNSKTNPANWWQLLWTKPKIWCHDGHDGTIGKSQKQRKHKKIKYGSESSYDENIREDKREDQDRYKPSEDIINKLTDHGSNHP